RARAETAHPQFAPRSSAPAQRWGRGRRCSAPAGLVGRRAFAAPGPAVLRARSAADAAAPVPPAPAPADRRACWDHPRALARRRRGAAAPAGRRQLGRLYRRRSRRARHAGLAPWGEGGIAKRSRGALGRLFLLFLLDLA